MVGRSAGSPGSSTRVPLLSSYSAELREVGFPEGSSELGFLGLGVALVVSMALPRFPQLSIA